MKNKLFGLKKNDNNSNQTAASKAIKCNATFKVGKVTIFDNYTVNVSHDTPSNIRVVHILETALATGNLQYAYLNVPLDVRYIGEDMLTESALCILLGKLSMERTTWFLWAYRNFKNEWYVCCTPEKTPDKVGRAARLVAMDSHLVHATYRTISIPADYITRLSHIYTNLQNQIK